MTISNELLSSTLHSIRKPAVDNLFRSTPILDLLKKKGGVVVGEHGPKVGIPWIMNGHSQPTAFPTGGEVANDSVQDVMQLAEFYPADLGMPLFISRKEEKENSGPGMMVKIAESRFRSNLSVLKKSVNKQLLAGTDVIAQRAGLATLYGHSSITSNGYLEGRTAQVSTVGGISKAAGATGLLNAWGDASDAFGANGPDAFTSVQTDIRTNSEFGDADIIIASKSCFKNVKRSMFAIERFTPADKLDGGRLDLAWGDATIAPDAEMPTHASADFEASAYFLNSQAMQLYFWEGCEFDLDDWMPIATGKQVGRITWLYAKLQLIPISLSANGFVSDGNTWA